MSVKSWSINVMLHRLNKGCVKFEDKRYLYNELLQEFEEPLIKAVMMLTNNNQTKAAKILGLNRGTFRKKLKLYGLIESELSYLSFTSSLKG